LATELQHTLISGVQLKGSWDGVLLRMRLNGPLLTRHLVRVNHTLNS